MKVVKISFVLMAVVVFNLVVPSVNCAQEKYDDQVFDFTAPPSTNILLLDVLYLGTDLEVEYIKEDNFDLDDRDAENETSTEASLSLALSYEPKDNLTFFLNIKPSYLDMDDENGQKHSDTKLELVQANMMIEDLIGKSELILGRQRFIDDRQWLYDEEIDGIRYTQYMEKFALELSAFKKNRQDLLSDARNDQAVNFMAQVHVALNKENKFNVFVFDRNDYSRTNDDFMIFGFQLSGNFDERWLYWLNSGVATGQNIDKDILGYGFDLGATHVFDLAFKPSVTFAYAYGSGDDDPNDNKDNNFRQTGFQDNSAKLNGVTDVKTYGELFDPELSNLSIYTGGLGVKPTKKSSIDLLYHYYRQNEASTSIRDSQIDKNSNGRDREIGHEVDLVIGVKVYKSIKFSVALGYLKPGETFGQDADDAKFINAEVKISF
jgi:alginate production protein